MKVRDNMITHKYGELKESQFEQTKQEIRKQIFFALLIADPKTRDNYRDVEVDRVLSNLLYKIGGLNSVLYYPPELVTVISLLESARIEYNNPSFDFKVYRKLVLDAGAEVLKIKEVL